MLSWTSCEAYKHIVCSSISFCKRRRPGGLRRICWRACYQCTDCIFLLSQWRLHLCFHPSHGCLRLPRHSTLQPLDVHIVLSEARSSVCGSHGQLGFRHAGTNEAKGPGACVEHCSANTAAEAPFHRCSADLKAAIAEWIVAFLFVCIMGSFVLDMLAFPDVKGPGRIPKSGRMTNRRTSTDRRNSGGRM